MLTKQRWTVIVLILCICLIATACRDSQENSIEVMEEYENKEKIVDSMEDPKVPSPISGILTEEKNIERRPIAVMLDNQSKARPQAGLDQAEVIYEILTEGWITRYMAIFLINEPELIGPVRSARPYFIDKAMEFDALYVHDGGSPQSLADISDFKIADISAQSRDKRIFWRENHKPRPHNEYTSASAIRMAAAESRYRERGEFEHWKFNKKDLPIQGSALSHLEIPYHQTYVPSFRYAQEKNLYYRYINDSPHVDEVSQEHLFAKNIIIQYAETKIIDSEGRREIRLVGKGEGLFISGGEMKPIQWEKENRRALTRFYDINGKEISLNPGITWIEVVPKNFQITTVP